MTDEQVREKLAQAIRALKSESPALNCVDVHERSTAHRLAVHMERYFRGWNVDCEYNRDGASIKTLGGMHGTGNIIPDITVHHRHKSGRKNNLGGLRNLTQQLAR